MQLWRFVLDADGRVDLTSQEKLKEWAHWRHGIAIGASVGAIKNDLPGSGTVIGAMVDMVIGGLFWHRPKDQAEADYWTKCVMALRKTGRTLKDFNNKRKPMIDEDEAGKLLREHVSYLSPRIVNTVDGAKFMRSIDTVVYYPMSLRGDQDIHNFKEAAFLFWQSVFGSMVFDAFSGFCGECGEHMGVTKKTGKPKRGDYCKKCLDKLRWKKIPEAKRKKINREKVRNWRAKQRASEKPK